MKDAIIKEIRKTDEKVEKEIMRIMLRKRNVIA